MPSLLDRAMLDEAVRECREGKRKLSSLTFSERRHYVEFLQKEIVQMQRGLLEGLGNYSLVYTERDAFVEPNTIYVQPRPPQLLFGKEPFQNVVVSINELLDEFTKVLEAFRWLTGENIEQQVRSELIKDLQGKSNA